MQLFHFTSVQLTATDYSLNGYMVAPREDMGTPLDGSVAYVGSWETGTDIKLLCNGVSTSICQLWYRYYDPTLVTCFKALLKAGRPDSNSNGT